MPKIGRRRVRKRCVYFDPILDERIEAYRRSHKLRSWTRAAEALALRGLRMPEPGAGAVRLVELPVTPTKPRMENWRIDDR